MKLAELIDEAVERARVAVQRKEPEPRATTQIAAVAAQVGVGAIKYADLSSDRIKDYIFDWDRMLAFEGNTGPYLQYAHARICSIARKAADEGRRRCGPARHLAHRRAERALAVELLELEAAVNAVADTPSAAQALHVPLRARDDVHRLLRKLLGATRGDPATRASRLCALPRDAAALARLGLGLLGIERARAHVAIARSLWSGGRMTLMAIPAEHAWLFWDVNPAAIDWRATAATCSAEF